MKPIGTVLKQIRKDKKMTQEQLAKKSKIPLSVIKEIERNPKEGPTQREQLAIMKALDAPKTMVKLLQLEKKDIPERKRGLFKALDPIVKDMAKHFLKL